LLRPSSPAPMRHWGMITLATAATNDALSLCTNVAQAGGGLHESTRRFDGGLRSTAANNDNRAACLVMYNSRVDAVLNDINAAPGESNGVTVSENAYSLPTADTAVLSEVQGQYHALLNEAPFSVGDSSATTAQELVRTRRRVSQRERRDATAARPTPIPIRAVKVRPMWVARIRPSKPTARRCDRPGRNGTKLRFGCQ
jgi:hypothetical protein